MHAKRNEFKKMLNSQLFLAGEYAAPGEQSAVSMSVEFDFLGSFGNQVNNAPTNSLFAHPKFDINNNNNNKKGDNEPCAILPTQFLIECVFLIFLDFGGLTRFAFPILF